MKFNIKNWQDKYLIKESKLRELDFKTPAEFKAYKARLKTKMRDTTKVNIAGKDTTAGEASGKETTAGEASSKKKEAVDAAYGAVEMLGDMITSDMEYDSSQMEDDLNSLKDTGVNKEDAKNMLDAEMKKIEDSYDEDEWEVGYQAGGEEAYPQDIKDELYKQLDDIYGEVSGKKKAAGRKIAGSQGLKDILDRMGKDKQNFTKGGQRSSNDPNAYITKSSSELFDHAETAFWKAKMFNSDKPISYQDISDAVDEYADEGEINAEDGERIKTLFQTELGVEDKAAKAEPKATSTPKAQAKADRDSIEDLVLMNAPDSMSQEKIASVVNDLEDEWKGSSDNYDSVDDYIEDLEREGGLEGYLDEKDNKKTESVIPKSTRIQESRMYKTIQELRAFEQGIWENKYLISEAELKFDFGKDTLGDQVRAQLDTMKQNPRKAVEKFTQDLIAASKSGKFKWKTNHPSTNYRFVDGVGKLFRIQGIKFPKLADFIFDKVKAAVGEGMR